MFKEFVASPLHDFFFIIDFSDVSTLDVLRYLAGDYFYLILLFITFVSVSNINKIVFVVLFFCQMTLGYIYVYVFIVKQKLNVKRSFWLLFFSIEEQFEG